MALGYLGVAVLLICPGITLFKFLGITAEDLALAKLIYDRAVRDGRGREVEFKGYFR